MAKKDAAKEVKEVKITQVEVPEVKQSAVGGRLAPVEFDPKAEILPGNDG